MTERGFVLPVTGPDSRPGYAVYNRQARTAEEIFTDRQAAEYHVYMLNQICRAEIYEIHVCRIIPAGERE
jgi:hypothetical protein